MQAGAKTQTEVEGRSSRGGVSWGALVKVTLKGFAEGVDVEMTARG